MGKILKKCQEGCGCDGKFDIKFDEMSNFPRKVQTLIYPPHYVNNAQIQTFSEITVKKYQFYDKQTPNDFPASGLLTK